MVSFIIKELQNNQNDHVIMKSIRTFILLMLALMAQTFFVACDDDSTDFNDDVVTISDDGTASDGSVFSSIDEKSFYLDHVKYQLNDECLVVTGIDNELFKGAIKVVFAVKYKGKLYEVHEIGPGAFFGSQISKISLPISIKHIADYAFRSCRNLTSINIPNPVTRIGRFAFYECENLSSIDIPSSVTTIGEWAFSGCSSLASVNIPSSMTSIGGKAFTGCISLKSIRIPSSVTDIGDNAFNNCPSLRSIVVDKDNPIYDSRNNCNAIVETSSNTLLYGCSNTIIYDSVTEIGKNAFIGCTSLTSIDIPNSVTEIGDGAFQGCI